METEINIYNSLRIENIKNKNYNVLLKKKNFKFLKSKRFYFIIILKKIF